MVSDYRLQTFQKLSQPLGDVLGEKTAKALAGLDLHTVRDLMYYIPKRYLKGTETTDLSELKIGDDIAVVAKIASMGSKEIRSGRRGRPTKRLNVMLTDGKGYLPVVFFGKDYLVEYWQKQLSQGDRGIFVGKIGTYNGQLQMSHPSFVMLDEQGNTLGNTQEDRSAMAKQVRSSAMIGIYRASSKIRTWQIAESANIVLDLLTGLEDPMPEEIRQEYRLPELLEAFTQIHRPSDLGLIEKAKERLKFNESLTLQTTMVSRRNDVQSHRAPKLIAKPDGIAAAFDRRLPFNLTDAQKRVGDEIAADIATDTPMQRLLQGEVGSGKTVVALRAMLTAVDNGKQAVLMAPTEVLAEQHYESISGLLGDLGHGKTLGAPDEATDIALLTGSMTTAQKRKELLKIADGQAGIVIGTHALLSDNVSFADLGLVIIDEQHRFGVEQRARLQTKAKLKPHNLVMTATPIPRSIAMTAFGDLEVSVIDEVPSGRKPVQTTVVDANLKPKWLDRVWQRMREEVAAGHQAFVVCPRITLADQDTGQDDGQETGSQPSAAVEEVYQQLAGNQLAGLNIAVLHGKLATEEKSAVMQDFVSAKIDVLISTTVIEVGVDIPNATMMVILDADRFGVSQLHQLRGRIGRGQYPGLCLLVTRAASESPAAERLNAVAATTNGFELAEIDLENRREGNVLGAQQSGTKSTLKLLRVATDVELIAETRKVAEKIVAESRYDDWVADMVTATEQDTDAQWLERS